MKHRIVRRLAPLSLLVAFAFFGCSSGDDDERGSPSSQAGSSGAGTGGSPMTGSSGGRVAAATGGTSSGGATGGDSSGGRGGSTSSGGVVGNGGTPQGGSTSTGSGFSSGLPDASTLDTLSPEELVGLCEASQEYLEKSASVAKATEGLCRYGGAFLAVLFEVETDAELRQLCAESYAECIAEPLEQEPCAMTSTCTATVAEFEACIDDYPALLASFDRIPACAELTLDDLAEVAEFMPDTPAGCASLWEKCPEENDFSTE
jgi:hypothetical protein